MIDEVLSCYPAPKGRSVAKEIAELDGYCRLFLSLCPFVVLSSASAAGEPDVSPRGGEPGFVHVLDPNTVLLADRPGNNRLDSLRKIAENPKVAMLCLVPGLEESLRIYGTAEVLPTASSPLDTAEHGRAARSVMVIHVSRAFVHCAKAVMRARLWDDGARVGREAFPPISEVLAAHTGLDGPLESEEDKRLRYEGEL